MHWSSTWLKRLEPISSFLAERLHIPEKLHASRWNVHYKLTVLYGEQHQGQHVQQFAAQLVSAVGIGIVLAMLLGIAAADPYVAGIGLLCTALLPFLLLQRLDRDLLRRKRSIVLELPELLNTMTLLINAGETVHAAMMRCAERYEAAGAQHPLALEWVKLANRLRNNESMPRALESFSKRCAVPEAAVMTTTILMNYKRGGDMLVMALRGLNRDLWEKQKAMTKTLGEEASSKLVFPMLFIFVAVMVIVAAPAVMLME